MVKGLLKDEERDKFEEELETFSLINFLISAPKVASSSLFKSFRKSGFFIFSILSIDNILYYIVW